MTRALALADLRKRKRKIGECRMCKRPAARSENGTVLSMCRTHLDMDLERKAARKAKR